MVLLKLARVAHKAVLSDARKYRDQCTKLEIANRHAKAQLVEEQKQTNKTNEELLNCQMMLKLRTAERVKLHMRLMDLQREFETEVNEKQKELRALHDEIAGRAVAEAELSTELERERSRSEEAMRRLSEIQKERPRVVAPPIFPQHSRERPVDSYPPSDITGRSSRISTNTLKEEDEEEFHASMIAGTSGSRAPVMSAH
ncbi:hypothetical protein COOONC_01258 [Cooperia oncophora]